MDPEAGGRSHGGPLAFYDELIEELVDWACEEFALQVRQQDGASLKDHLLAGSPYELPERLAQQPPIPHTVVHVWNWFCQLDSARGSNGWGPSSLSYADIVAWGQVTGTAIEPWEVRAIFRLDAAYFEHKVGPEARIRDKAKP